MVGNGELHESSVENACREFNESVKTILALINRQIEEILVKNYEDLEELAEKIGARANFLSNNPDFLSKLTYKSRNVKVEPLKELDDIRITLGAYARRFGEKIDDIDRYHKALFDIVTSNSQDKKRERLIEEVERTVNMSEEQLFEDCLDRGRQQTEEEETAVKIVEDAENGREQEETAVAEDTKATESEAKEEIENTKQEVIKKETSFDRVVIAKNAFSDLSMDKRIMENLPDLPIKEQLFPDVPADVSRIKPLEDLHGKLLQQLEATDSLESFVKLMERKPSKLKKIKAKKNEHIEEKYTGSLYFFPQKKSKNALPSPTPSQRSTKTLSTTKQKQPNHKSSTCCNLLITSSHVPCTNRDKTRRAADALGRTKLKCYDLLDDLDGKDLKPIKSEYPRRDNLYEQRMNKMKLQDAKTYLHRMMEESEKVWKKLIRPEPETPKVKQAKNLMAYLTHPQRKFLDHRPKSVIVMPVKVVYDNFPTKESTLAERKRPVATIADPSQPPTEAEPTTTEATKTAADDPFAILGHLKGMKARNRNIQTNIQQAIDVIESKIVDVLSEPNDSNESAFAAMEVEIRNVLRMMSESELKKAEAGPKKVEKVEAEKDEAPRSVRSSPTSPKLGQLRRTATIVKTPRQMSPVKDVRKPKQQTRRIADIEEGERLLGQVDSVIKKIDNISTKFGEDKQKKLTKKDSSYNNVIEFFDGLRHLLENNVKGVEVCAFDEAVEAWEEARCYYPTAVYYEATFVAPKPCDKGDFIEPTVDVDDDKIVDDEETMDDQEMEEEERYSNILKRFYTFFFSSVFVALNFDFAA